MSGADNLRRLFELDGLFHTAPVGLAVFDRDLRYVRVNPRLADLNGVSVEAHLGRTMGELFPPLAALAEPFFREVVETGQSILDRPLLSTTEPQATWFLSVHPLLDDTGSFERFGVVVSPLDERARMELALAEQQQQLEESQRIGRLGSFWWSARTDRWTWSPETHRLFGVPLGQATPTPESLLAAIHPEDRARVAEADRHALATGADEWEVEYRTDPSRGPVRFILARTVATRDAGALVRLAGTFLDVTERVELETRLRHAQKLEALGQLAGGVAHDFNNLLTIISGHLEFAREGLPVGSEVRADLDVVNQAAERARTVVRQLLAFSRKQRLRPIDLDVRDIVRGTEPLLLGLISEEVALLLDLGDAPARVLADAGQLEQLLMNLAINARDAMLTPRNGSEGRGGTLRITVRVLEGFVELRVQDDGHGMDEATREHVFEPFFTTRREGTGLGLATVYGIVTQSGGTIRVESTPGKGTTFTVLLPEAAAASDSPVDSLPERTSTPPRTRGLVLLAEDENAVRSTARRFLERSGFEVLEARDGLQALQIWQEKRAAIALLVSDLRMPGMGGRELLQAIRKDVPLPAVFISGYADVIPESSRHTLLVEKPFTGAALLGAVERLLRR